MEQFPLEKKKVKTGGMIPSHKENKRETTSKWVGKAETQSHCKPHPQ